ncbi:hypothetical protein Pelo_10953 [Pelomyxa schiedti]|nr:hypothetical protein Pelo_10953 [Pelomyxa schiedti]
MKQFRPSCGSQFDYVEPVVRNKTLEGMLCGVCRGPWLSPVTHLTCGCTFCSSCITTPACPQCKQDVTVNQKVPVMARYCLDVLDNLLVKCPTCKESVARHQVVAHWNRCKQPCPQGCGELVAPLLYTSHVEESCMETIIECPLCHYHNKREIITSADHKQTCPVDCPNGCGAKVAPKDFPQHNETCLDAVVPCLICTKPFKRGKMATEHIPFCPIPCSCGELVAPRDKVVHDRVCKMAPVPCSGGNILCPWTGSPLELPNHEKHCPFLAMKDVLAPFAALLTRNFTHLSPSNCKGAQLANQDMSRRFFRGWNFAGANLSGANFELSDLSLADLSGADLTNANFIQARLKGTILARADLSNAVLAGANLKKADLSGACLKGANLVLADLSGASITGAVVSNANLVGVKRYVLQSLSTELDKSQANWPRNCWRQMENLDLRFSNSDLTVANITNNTQSTFATVGIPLGGVFTWRVKVVSVDCRHAGVGVAIPTAQIGKGNHGDKEGCWKWQAGGLTFSNASSVTGTELFASGDVLTLLVDRRKEPTIFTISKSDKEIKRFSIATQQEVIPFIAPCCRGNEFTTEFNIPQPCVIDLPGVIGMESAILREAEPVDTVLAPPPSASSTSQLTGQKFNSQWSDDKWKKHTQVSVQFSDNDLTVTNTDNCTQSTISQKGISPGSVRYWTIKVNACPCHACGCGVAIVNKFNYISTSHADTGGCWKWEAVGRMYINGVLNDHCETFTTGDVLGLLCDRRLGKNTLTLYKNEKQVKVMDLTETELNIHPCITPCCRNASFTANFCVAPPPDVSISDLGLLPLSVDPELFPKDTWRPYESTDLVVSNNSLTVTNSTNRPHSISSHVGIPTGITRYWQILVEGRLCPVCGVAVSLDSAQIGPGSHADGPGCWKWESVGRFFANGILISQLCGYVEGDEIGVLVDRMPGKGTVTFFKNGEEVTVLKGLPEDPAVLVYPTVTPCGTLASFTAFFAAQPFNSSSLAGTKRPNPVSLVSTITASLTQSSPYSEPAASPPPGKIPKTQPQPSAPMFSRPTSPPQPNTTKH